MYIITMPILIAYDKNFHHLLLSIIVAIDRNTFTKFTEVHKDFIAKEFGLKAVMFFMLYNQVIGG